MGEADMHDSTGEQQAGLEKTIPQLTIYLFTLLAIVQNSCYT